ncbi:hypothetical protein [Methyloversatilis sp.]|uniref:hypothetical protein n=1 Tax=Methyloversatilis sp. TaxID=2569862 RepID=UPI002733D8A6|nr:hypothetical protein [Methyloversatilis sp.]MDP3287588.1 hypothetical protein [Methyloversatilis sp.]MDP3454542.1 hypothetical protein [Methyloversatilis sp.]MDP3579161.1 hypothetical protein [Methyloversatilis sp.]
MFHLLPKTLLVCAALVPTSAWPADPADPAAPVPSADYRSMIDGYRSHAAEPVGPWRDANDRVGRQTGAHAAHADHPEPANPQLEDPHAGHSAPAGARAEGSSAHDHGAGNPAAHDHRMHHGKPAADAGNVPHHCMHHDNAAGGGMKHKHDACPMKKEGGHAHH